jgi:hypothetical protein
MVLGLLEGEGGIQGVLGLGPNVWRGARGREVQHFGPGHEKREGKREIKRGGGAPLGFVKDDRGCRGRGRGKVPCKGKDVFMPRFKEIKIKE